MGTGSTVSNGLTFHVYPIHIDMERETVRSGAIYSQPLLEKGKSVFVEDVFVLPKSTIPYCLSIE